MLTWREAALAVVCTVLICGCEPPGGIITASPPGTDPVRKPPDSEQPAEALGETSARANVPAVAAPAETKVEIAPPTAKGETKTTPGGVKYETLKEGSGPEVKPGQTAKVHYTGTLENGKQFDSSRGRGPFSFKVGEGAVIRGWHEGVAGMKVGEQRKLTIPPALGYKDQAAGEIPPNSTLIFEIELLGVE